MNTRTRTIVGVTLALFALAAVPAFAKPQQAATGGAVYHATLIDTSAVLRRESTAPIRIRLDRLTSDAEVEALSNAARRGAAAFREVFFTRAIGRIDINGRLGDPVYYARRYSDAKGEHLIAVAQRSIDAREHFANRRSVAYPYTVVELDLDAEGQMGSYTFAARLEPQRDGTIDYRSLAFVPGRLMAVRQLND